MGKPGEGELPSPVGGSNWRRKSLSRWYAFEKSSVLDRQSRQFWAMEIKHLKNLLEVLPSHGNVDPTEVCQLG